MSAFKAVVIGCGGAGTNHAVGYSKLPDVQFVGAADIDLSKAQALTAKVGGVAYASFEELILTEKPDLVSVCTREYDHDLPAIFALENGCHVLSEKIMAHSLQAGTRMAEAAMRSGKQLGVDYNYRFIDSIQILKQQLDAGAIGDVKTASFQVHAYCHHHALDLIRFLFGDPDELISTLTEIDAERNYPWDRAHELLYIPSYNETTVIRFGRMLLTLTACHRSFRYPLMEIDIVGTHGILQVCRMNIASVNGEVTIQHEERIDRIVPEPLTLDDTFYRSVASWVDTLKGNPTVSATGEDGLQTMMLEQAISRSHREKRYIIPAPRHAEG
ncbi:Gfo/Idh/MocA family protein [Cohnella hongkongensis]|uniref:Gfo/Idh/MocA family protein n=1 Tax=Cohnella hongkongensis TaxID=178337 RepID=A0ABV9F6H0_9BACL